VREWVNESANVLATAIDVLDERAEHMRARR
jgi:hypothetical protein